MPTVARRPVQSWPIDAIEGARGLLEREPRAGHTLRGRPRGLYSLRVGACRILYQLTDGEQTIRVVAIPHRSAAYDKDPRWASGGSGSSSRSTFHQRAEASLARAMTASLPYNPRRPKTQGVIR